MGVKNVYLNIDEQGKVLDLSFESGTFYCEVDEVVTADEVKQSIGFNDYNLSWQNNCLVADQPKKLSEMDLLKAQLNASLEQNKFLEDCLIELASVVYA
ncbi:hypothetical protein [Vaginisenegalia massiliensis]|uniref:hypothetical protein n=1 Tax=Vaginisenegalia massiliensis TaxID=2058294 RepID=UPI000F523D8F|nr:hypothetical protein [Vaginisenegalia massiliensis]